MRYFDVLYVCRRAEDAFPITFLGLPNVLVESLKIFFLFHFPSLFCTVNTNLFTRPGGPMAMGGRSRARRADIL
jgi:hypothetical protein